MPRHRQPRTIDERVDALTAISADLLATAAAAPIALAEAYRSAWFDTVGDIVERGVVLVFDDFAIGPPEPLLLEARYHLRLMRRAEYLGAFDDEEADWYDEHPDDRDAVYEPPTRTERVLTEMAEGQQAERLTTGQDLSLIVHRRVQPERNMYVTMIRLELTLERLLVELADTIRIGDCAVVDARLPAERIEGWWWAA